MAGNILTSVLVFTLFFAQSIAKTVTYDFNLTWVMANPDGLAERKVIGVNNTWPLPVINVDKGDQLIVNAYNGLGDKDASIHFHGMFQNGTNNMDGANMVTQCPIPPGSSFTYNFTVNQNGTYWYHCHTGFCYPDGYRQALVVHDEDAWFKDEFDDDFTITLSDWYHDLVEDIEFLSLFNPTGAEPIPDSFLFNDTMDTSLSVEPGKTYLIRLINTAAFVAQYFYVEDHTFKIIEMDGVYTEPTEADTLYIAVAQRYTILLTTKNSTDRNYAIVTVADSNLLDGIPSDLQLNNTNWLEYNSSAAKIKPDVTLDVIDGLPAFDDATLVPYDHEPLYEDPDYTINMTIYMQELANGLPYAFFNNITYTEPKVPVLYTALSSGDQSTDSVVYGEYTNPFVLPHNGVIEVIINNADGGTHPIHLHGHNFQILQRYPAYGANFYDLADNTDPTLYDPTTNGSNAASFPTYPPRRDVLIVPPMGYFVIRFRADNPGVWMFHCHIDWHLSQGLAAVFVEAPEKLVSTLSIPEDHYASCRAADIPYTGNAAANTNDFTDLTGQNKQPAWIPYGSFTPKGYAAMAFSVVSAVLGILALTVYGLSDLKYARRDVRQPTKEAVSGTGAGEDREMTKRAGSGEGSASAESAEDRVQVVGGSKEH